MALGAFLASEFQLWLNFENVGFERSDLCVLSVFLVHIKNFQ